MDHAFEGEGCEAVTRHGKDRDGTCSCKNDRGLVLAHHCDSILGLPVKPLPVPPRPTPPEPPVVVPPVPLSAPKPKPKGKRYPIKYEEELDNEVAALRKKKHDQ